jgi:uncharacterized protein (TIGR03083 family)
MTATTGEWVAALEASYRRNADAVDALADGAETGPSYCSEWTVAQVLSHLGSGAEIFGLILDAGLTGSPAPGPDAFGPIWEAWNGRSPADQAADSVVANRAFLDRIASIDPAAREAWSLEFFGARRSFDQVLQMRLGEHTLHTWDIVVEGDPSATVPDDAATLLVDRVDELVGRLGKPAEPPWRVAVTTTDPARHLVLSAGESGAELRAAGTGDGAPDDPPSVVLPAESLIRLVYGRLDAEHTPASVTADGIDLDEVRRTFPGF